jgi:hypothetical protein
MYRLLRENNQTGERRAQASHPAKKKPELLATGPNASAATRSSPSAALFA